MLVLGISASPQTVDSMSVEAMRFANGMLYVGEKTPLLLIPDRMPPVSTRNRESIAMPTHNSARAL